MEEEMAGRVAVAVADNIVSPLGLTSSANYAAVKAGRTGLKRYSGQWGLPEPFVASLMDRQWWIPNPPRRGEQKGELTFFERMAVYSIKEALEHCDVDVTSDRTLIILSTTKGNVELIEGAENRIMLGEAAKEIANYLGNPNQPLVVSNACISGVCAQIEAQRLLKAGEYDDVIVCGVDVLSPFIVSGFQSLKALTDTPCRPFDEDRTGINLGDAAATIIYKGIDNSQFTIHNSQLWCLERGAIRNDAFHISSPSNVGEGCFRALSQILKGVDPEKIAFVNAHGTATLFNDEMESVAIERAGLSKVPVNSLKGYFGHTMGAAGVLETIISMKALDEGVILKTKGYQTLGVSREINVTAQNGTTDKRSFVKMMSGFGGCNAAMLFTLNFEL